MSKEYCDKNDCNHKCDSCNKAACQGCDNCDDECVTKCQVQCDEAQTLIGNCTTLKEVVGKSFTFSVRPTANKTQMGPNDGQFSQSVWEEIITYYNSGAAIGTLKSFLDDIDTSKTEDVAPFKKDEYNRIAEAAGATRRVRTGDKIYGSYFTELETAISSKTGNSDACDRCNSGCDCDTGNDSPHCNACQSCNTTCYTCNSECSDNNCKEDCCGCDSGDQQTPKTP